MKYNVYRVEDGAENEPFDNVDLNLLIDRGVYIFYVSRPDSPEVVYPINSFWVMKEVS